VGATRVLIGGEGSFKALGAGDEAREAGRSDLSRRRRLGFKALGAGDEAREYIRAVVSANGGRVSKPSVRAMRLARWLSCTGNCTAAMFQSPRCGR